MDNVDIKKNHKDLYIIEKQSNQIKPTQLWKQNINQNRNDDDLHFFQQYIYIFEIYRILKSWHWGYLWRRFIAEDLLQKITQMVMKVN